MPLLTFNIDYCGGRKGCAIYLVSARYIGGFRQVRQHFSTKSIKLNRTEKFIIALILGRKCAILAEFISILSICVAEPSFLVIALISDQNAQFLRNIWQLHSCSEVPSQKTLLPHK